MLDRLIFHAASGMDATQCKCCASAHARQENFVRGSKFCSSLACVTCGEPAAPHWWTEVEEFLCLRHTLTRRMCSINTGEIALHPNSWKLYQNYLVMENFRRSWLEQFYVAIFRDCPGKLGILFDLPSFHYHKYKLTKSIENINSCLECY